MGDDYLENGHGVLLLVVEFLLIGYNPYWGLWLSGEKVSKQENPINFGSLLFRIMPVLGSKRAIEGIKIPIFGTVLYNIQQVSVARPQGRNN